MSENRRKGLSVESHENRNGLDGRAGSMRHLNINQGSQGRLGYDDAQESLSFSRAHISASEELKGDEVVVV